MLQIIFYNILSETLFALSSPSESSLLTLATTKLLSFYHGSAYSGHFLGSHSTRPLHLPLPPTPP